MTLEEFFRENPCGALAFSGGTDSSLLVWAAKKYGRNWRAYYVKAAFQPEFEFEDAQRISEQCGLPLTVIEADILSHEDVVANPANRCYLCKQVIFSNILKQAKADGYTFVVDGTNASDDVSDRPGMQALKEMNVRSPLRECGLAKADVRELSRQAGLFTWNKPSYACLATRIPTGTAITAEALEKVEKGEILISSMGFSNFRIRLHGMASVLQFTDEQLKDAFDRRDKIREELSKLFSIVSIDLKPRKKAE